ncbi:DUF3316 domain-containing protein [Leucothrix sargassi]|nr:DUF3316 domain-containing protein [Leucothrix sargassi]
MKTLTTLAIATTLLVSTNIVKAEYLYNPNQKVVQTEATTSKESAYQLGLNKLNALQGASPRALSNALGLYSPIIKKNSIRLNQDAYVTVQERVTPAGQKVYVGLVNLDVSYRIHRDDN